MRFVQLVALAAALTCAAALVLVGPAGAAPKPGKYTGKTSEKGLVTLTVSPNGKTVLSFYAQDGYNDACHFAGGVGGIKNFTVNIARMVVTKSGEFSSKVTESDKPFPGSTVLEVIGRLTGAAADGTVTALGQTCGSRSPDPKASLYLETFSARNG